MKTIFFCVVCLLSIISWFISLVIYFVHDDLARGSESFMNLEKLRKKFLTLEIVLHFIITMFALMYNTYVIFILNMPILLYNIKILV